MKKRSLVLAALLSAGVSVSADTITEAFAQGKASGELKAFYINRTYDGVLTQTRDGLSVGGHLNYNTAKYYGFDVGATFYTTNKVDEKSDVDNEMIKLFLVLMAVDTLLWVKLISVMQQERHLLNLDNLV